MSANGRVHMLWSVYKPDLYTMKHRYKDPLGVWSTTFTIGGSSDEIAYLTNPAMDASGNLQLVFDRSHVRGIGLKTWTTAWSSTTGVRSAPYDMRAQNTLPIGADLYNFFQRNSDGSLNMCRRVGGVWSGPTVVKATYSAHHTEIVDATGRIWCFATTSVGGYATVTYAIYTPATNTWSAWQTLDSEAGKNVQYPSATLDASGNVWVFYNIGEEIFYRVWSTGTSSWSERRRLTSSATDGACIGPQARYQAYSSVMPSKIDVVFRGCAAGTSGPYRIRYAGLSAAVGFTAPRGFEGTLSRDGSGYRLAFKDRSYLSFDSSGTLLSETDKNAQSVTYSRPAGRVDITAANGQRIAVSLDASGSVTNATYGTADGTRTVDYSAANKQVTYFPGKPGVEYTVEYDYDAAARLSTLTVPGYSPGGTDARWGFAYGTGGGDVGKLVRDELPGYASDSTKRKTISYGAQTASVGWYGQVDGVNGRSISQTYCWNADGTESSRKEPLVLWGEATPTAFAYGPTNELLTETSPMGGTKRYVRDMSGNLVAGFDELGHRTTRVYDSSSQLIEETDPRGSTTTRHYDTRGNLDWEERVLDGAGTLSHAAYAYDECGRTLSETRRISATETVTKLHYGGFAPNGQPYMTTDLGVSLSEGSAGSDLITHKAYDELGDQRWELNPLLEWTQVPTTYDIAGRPLMRTDASGTVTRYAYDVLGNEIETSRTAAGTSVADWTRRAFDAEGRSVVETYYKDADGTPDRTVTHTYDQRGKEPATTDQIAGTTTNRFDASGRTTNTWRPAAASATETLFSTRRTYDADGRELKVIDPGNPETSATVTEYYADGAVSKATKPDGSWESYTYDEAGNKVGTTKPTDAGLTVTEHATFDLGGRCVQTSEPDGAQTTNTYDLLGRQTSARAANATPTAMVYNNQGWLLRQTESDGVAKLKTYDGAGRTPNETKRVAGAADEVTTRRYDGMGRTVEQANPDTTKVEYVYDVFGHVRSEVHRKGSDPRAIKSTETTSDALGRPLVVHDAVLETTQTHTWETTATARHTVTWTYGGTVTTVTLDPKERELSRESRMGTSTIVRTTLASGRDAANRPLNWTVDAGSGPIGAAAAYDAAGKTTVLSGLGWAPEGARYTYDPNTSRMTARTDRLLLGTDSAAYLYDQSGRLVSPGSLVYDTAGSITQFEAPILRDGLPAQQYQSLYYGGQCLSMRRFWDTRGGQGSWIYEYYPDGSRKSAYINDWSPPVLTIGSESASWSGGRLTSYGRTANIDSANASFVYDAAGQRTQATVDSTPAGAPTRHTTTGYVYEGLSLLSLTETDTVTGDRTTITYLYDENSRPYAGFATLPGTAAPYRFNIITNALGDVVELTDEAGVAFQGYSYGPYGDVEETHTVGTDPIPLAVASKIGRTQPLRYRGYAFDEFSGLYYLSQRYYDPRSGQFISKDPAKADGEKSAYMYCAGDPINKVDPSGEIAGVAVALPVLGTIVVGAAAANYLNSSQGRAAARWVVDSFGKAVAKRWAQGVAVGVTLATVYRKGWGIRTETHPNSIPHAHWWDKNGKKKGSCDKNGNKHHKGDNAKPPAPVRDYLRGKGFKV